MRLPKQVKPVIRDAGNWAVTGSILPSDCNFVCLRGCQSRLRECTGGCDRRLASDKQQCGC